MPRLLSLGQAQKAAHVLVVLLVLSSLPNIGGLTWSECIRLLAIQVGLIWVYRRNAASVDHRSTAYAGSVIVALVVAFVMTQFDPATSASVYRSRTEDISLQFVVSLILSLALLGVVLVSKARRSLVWSSLGRLDRVVLGVILAAVVTTIVSRRMISGSLDQQVVVGSLRILLYAFIWVAVTRIYGAENWEPQFPGAVGYFFERWRGILIFSSLLFLPAIVHGSVRATLVVYHFSLGRERIAKQDFDNAIEHLERAEQLNETVNLGPIRDRALSELAVLYLQRGQVEAGARAIGRLKGKTHDQTKAFQKEGDVYLRADEWGKAAQAYRTALRLGGRDDAVIDNLGKVLLEMQDARGFLQLIDEYHRAPVVNAEIFDHLIFLGNVDFYRDRFTQARDYYMKAEQSRPGDSYPVYKTGRTFLAQGRYEQAVTRFEKAIDLSSTFADAHFRLGQCYEGLGDRDRALGMYRKTSELLPNHLEAMESLARLQKDLIH